MPDGLLSRLSRQPPCSQNTLAASDRPVAVFQPLARVFILVAAETLSKRPCRPRHPYSLLSPILLLFFRCLLPCPIRTRVSLRSRMARFCGRATASFFRSCAPAGAPPPSGNLPEKYRKTTGLSQPRFPFKMRPKSRNLFTAACDTASCGSCDPPRFLPCPHYRGFRPAALRLNIPVLCLETGP